MGSSAEKASEKKIVICISGLAGSGKSTVARRIAEHYGLRYCSGGEALKNVAAEMGYETAERGWWETSGGMNFLEKRLDNPDLDRHVDEKMLEWAGEGNVVLDSWTMPWLLRDGFKIWLEASENVRAQRVARRDGIGVEEALRLIREREGKTKEIYRRLYGFRLGEDFEPFQVILDVNNLDQEEVFKALCLIIDNMVLKKSQPSV
ncbi:cytidylate kinase family protein [Candidatus Bathyarchaeota archaeon]|nr:cytidylate kinase family protein [Candidatus Bathyarchaeota archaeon]